MDLIMLFLPELVGTFVGAAIAVWTTWWWDSRKNAQEKRDQTIRTIDSLIGEIDLLKGAAEHATADPQDGSNDAPVAKPGGAFLVTFDLLFLPDAAFRSAGCAGGLALLPADLQVSLSGFYESVGWARLHRDNIATSYNHAATVEENVTYLENAKTGLRVGASMMLSEVAELLKALQQQREIVERGRG